MKNRNINAALFILKHNLKICLFYKITKKLKNGTTTDIFNIFGF
jgi:hypothetical protein